jgi:glycosyltransferase involved in cell wall biosynthesis
MPLTVRKRVLIVEPLSTGHRAVWVKWLAEGLARRDWSVSVSMRPPSLESEPIRHLQRLAPEVRFHSDPRLKNAYCSQSSLGVAIGELRAWQELANLYDAGAVDKPDVVLVPYLDYCLHAIALKGSPFGSTPWIGVVMRPTFHHRTLGIESPLARFAAIRTLLFQRLIAGRSLRACLPIDETLVEFVRSKWPALSARVSYLPDPALQISFIPKSAARSALGIPQDGSVVLVYGWLDGRKGLRHLVAALECPAVPTDMRILLVGEQDRYIKMQLEQPGLRDLRAAGRLFTFDGWASESIEAAAFSAADVVWLGYEGHLQSSGLLVQACNAGVPVVGCREGLIGWSVTKAKCGLAVHVQDPAAVALALAKLTTKPHMDNRWTAGCQRLAQRHSLTNAVDVVERALG